MKTKKKPATKARKKLGGKRRRTGLVSSDVILKKREDFYQRGANIHSQILGATSPPPEEEIIVITISKSRAQRISHNLSDILCWAEGFKAGVRTMDEYSSLLGPFNNGITSIRDIQDLIKYKL